MRGATLKLTVFLVGVLMLQSVGCWSRAPKKRVLSVPALFARPLITGASVSANHGTGSPGRRLGLRYGAEASIKTAAFSGTPGRDVEPKLTDEMIADRTVIVAMDFFFWDSTLRVSQPSLDAIDSLVRKAALHEVPLVLGDIPYLLPFRQPARKELNKHLRAACETYSGCRLLELEKLHEELERNGFIEIEGKKRTRIEFIPDGLHLSDLGANYLTGFIEKALQ